MAQLVTGPLAQSVHYPLLQGSGEAFISFVETRQVRVVRGSSFVLSSLVEEDRFLRLVRRRFRMVLRAASRSLQHGRKTVLLIHLVQVRSP